MKLLKNNILYFCGLLHVSIPALLVVLWYVWRILHTFSLFPIDNDVMFGLVNPQCDGFMLFVAFLYLSYEYFYSYKKSGIEETARAQKNGMARSLWSMLCVPGILVCFLFVFAVIITIITAVLGDVTDGFYYLHIVLVNFLNVFLLCLLACLLGGCLAMRFKRVPSYTVMVLLVFLISPAINMFLFMLSSRTGVDFFQFQWFFSMALPQNTSLIPDGQYGVSNEIFRWNLTFFWFFLLAAVLLITALSKKQKRRVVAVSLCAVLAAANLAGYFRGGSYINYSDSVKSISRYDREYYRDAEKKEEKAGFTVDTYDMELSLWRDLGAKVTMHLNNPKALTEYKFTLYRDFNIKQVADGQGAPLSYTREGDYLTVRSDTPVQAVTIRYQGKSNIFYSNCQAAALPGSFPYYPMAGFHILSDSAVEESGQIVGAEGYLPVSNGFEAQYNIKVDSIRPVYSNLAQVGEQQSVFSGKAQFPTLMSGFIEKKEEGGYTYYPQELNNGYAKMTAKWLDSLQKEIDRLEQENGVENHLALSEKTIFQTTHIFTWASYTYVAALDDQVFITYCDDDLINDVAQILVEEYAAYD